MKREEKQFKKVQEDAQLVLEGFAEHLASGKKRLSKAQLKRIVAPFRKYIVDDFDEQTKREFIIHGFDR